MRSSVIITKTGDRFYCTVSGKFGGGFSNARAGLTPGEAAGFAAKKMIEYGQCNPEGADLVAPEEVIDLIPKHLRSIGAKKDGER